MPTTNTPAQIPQDRDEPANAQGKERLHPAEREQKFVIKLSMPVPT